MRRLVSRRALAALAASLAVAATPLAGCGGNEPGVPKRDASELVRLLRKVQSASFDPQKCDELAAAIVAVRAKVRALPSKVDADVRDSLRNGVKNLADSARQQCQNTNTTPTETTPTETTPTQTVPPVTTQAAPPPTTQTAPPPPTTATIPPPPTATPPPPPTTGGTGPGSGGGNGQGNANGQGKGVGKKPKGPKNEKKPKGKDRPHGPKARGHGR